MSNIWIVHRDARARAALTRLAAAPEDTVLGAPRDPIFETASGASAVVLGLAGDDLELELDFAHHSVPRLPGCQWIVVSDGADPGPLRELFDGVPLTVLNWPPHPDALRAALGSALANRPAASLSQRRYHSRLQVRFARWFSDLELPQLLRAVDPATARLPLLVRGELGTGRELLARYVHGFGRTAGKRDPFVALACTPTSTEGDLFSRIDAALGAPAERCTLWFDELDRLPETTQRAVQAWIEFGIPRGSLRNADLRFAASVRDGAPQARPRLVPGLLAAFGGLGLRIPPLRDRASAIDAIATDMLRGATPEHERVRALSNDALEVLREHPWPENLRELEAVLLRTIASTSADPIEARHLCFEPVGPMGTPAGAPNAAPTPDRARLGRPGGSAVPEAIYLDDEPDDGRGDDRGDDAAAEAPSDPVEATFSFAGAGARADGDGGPSVHELESPWDETPVQRSRRHDFDLTAEMAREASSHDDAGWRHVVRAMAHEFRNPLVSVRTLAELLPEQHGDPGFRERMSELVAADVSRMERLLDRLERSTRAPVGPAESVDLSALIETLLEQRTGRVQQRRLLVLRELEHTRPEVLADPLRLQPTIEALLDRALERVQDRGDVYVATRFHGAQTPGGPAVRMLLRFSRAPSERAGSLPGRGAASLELIPEATNALRDTSETENTLDIALAEVTVRSLGGQFSLDASRDSETVIVIDLPAPG